MEDNFSTDRGAVERQCSGNLACPPPPQALDKGGGAETVGGAQVAELMAKVLRTS